MKRLILSLAILAFATSLFAQNRNTEGLKKLSESEAKDLEELADLSELASLAELGSLVELANLAELSSLAELSELAELAELSELANENFVIDLSELSIDLQNNLQEMQINLNDNLNYNELIEKAMKEVRKELKVIKDEQ